MSNMKDIMAQNRSMADMLREVASSPVPPADKKLEEQPKEIKEDTRTKESRKPSKRKSESEIKSKMQNLQIDSLVSRLKEYKLEGKTNRITYIISEKSISFLKILKSETGLPITDLINFFLEDSIQNNKIEIDKIIQNHIKNLKL